MRATAFLVRRFVASCEILLLTNCCSQGVLVISALQDPLDLERYYQHSNFLADVNNEAVGMEEDTRCSQRVGYLKKTNLES